MIQGIYPPNDTEKQNDIILFYLERMMDLWEKGYDASAKTLFTQFQAEFSPILPGKHFTYLLDKSTQERQWSHKIEQEYYMRLKNAILFGEWQTVHDCAHEILLQQRQYPHSDNPLFRKVLNYLAQSNSHYIEPHEIALNTFLDTQVEFIVENGNPGFRLHDVVGNKYRCFIKDIDNVRVGDPVKLKITNIPGFEINSRHKKEKIIYVEPRVNPGDLIEVEISSLSHSGNSFTFRHRSYDGFLWIKKRGVNKQIFNEKTLHPKDRVIAKILYITEEIKQTSNGSPSRLGLIKAIPIKRVLSTSPVNAQEETNISRAYN